MTFRIGFGYDAHRFKAGRPLMLGGVAIPFEMGLEGHSDADVLTHAIADAILGALGDGDIGQHFPPGDPNWKDAASLKLLAHVMVWAKSRKATVVNVDATLVLEAPKIAPHAAAMRKAIGEVLGIPAERVSIKATTSEGMGAVGRGEGAVAHAVVLLELETEE
jgi:2-C-methyl-D-erythritol 2,4-cyclodiphosphate synthase